MKFKTILFLVLALNWGCAAIKGRPPVLSIRTAEMGTLILEVHMFDVKNGWALAQSGQGVNFHHLLLHTANGGESWMDGTPRSASNDMDMDAYFFDSRHGWLWVRDRKKEIDYLLLTVNGAKSWTHVDLPFHFEEGSACHFSNLDHGIASESDGGLGSFAIRFFETFDGGRNWKLVPIVPPAPEMNLPACTIHLSSMSPDTASYLPPATLIITHGDMLDEQPKDAVRLSISTNLGKTWRDLNLPLPSERYRDGLVDFMAPLFLDATHGWLAARVSRRNTNDTLAWNAMVFYTTADGGQTWAPRPGIIDGGTNSFGAERQLNFVSARNAFVCAGACLFVTHDGAKSWQRIKPNIDFDRTVSNGGVAQIDFVDKKHGWAVVYDTYKYPPWDKCYLYKTSDGGATWTELPLKIVP